MLLLKRAIEMAVRCFANCKFRDERNYCTLYYIEIDENGCCVELEEVDSLPTPDKCLWRLDRCKWIREDSIVDWDLIGKRVDELKRIYRKFGKGVDSE